jgi:hypothetical protein
VIDNLVDSISEESIERLCRCIENREHDYICLNDPDHSVNTEILAGQLKQSFEELLPDKSSFEI